MCKVVTRKELDVLKSKDDLSKKIRERWAVLYEYHRAARVLYDVVDITVVDAIRFIDTRIREDDILTRFSSFCHVYQYKYDDVVSFVARIMWAYPDIDNATLVKIGLPRH